MARYRFPTAITTLCLCVLQVGQHCAAQPKPTDASHSYDAAVSRLQYGGEPLVNGDYISTMSQQKVKRGVANVASDVSRDSQTYLGSLVVQPGGKVVANNIIIVTEFRDLTVVKKP